MLKGIVHSKFDKWGVNKYDPSRKAAVDKVRENIEQFAANYNINDSEIIHDPIQLHFDSVKKFYNKRSEKCKEITNQKLKGKSESRKSRIKEKRINGVLPDSGDIWLMASALSVDEENNLEVGVWTYDSDFVEFSEDIENKMNITIFEEELPK